jgi:predicted N-acetyltransferase YhbS
MTIEIRAAKELAATERSQMNTCLDEAFAHDDFGHGYRWATNDWDLLLKMDGKVVSHVGIVERTVTVEGQPFRVGGIGAVGTSPRWQRRGLAHQLMEKAAAFMRADLRAEFGLLICSDEMTSYYGRLGWQVVPGPLLIDQPQGKITLPTTIMVLPLGGDLWPAGTIDLCGLPW